MDFAASAAILNGGGLLIYPTETFLALGCRYDSPDAVVAVSSAKGRAPEQTLPLICASVEQAQQLVDPGQIPEQLLSRFWPGPLTLILSPRVPAPRGIANANGKIALRVTSRPEAAALAGAAGPLTSSSANLHGEAPTVNAAALAPGLLRRLERICLPFGIFKGNLNGEVAAAPSTIVEPVRLDGRWRLRLLREGAISARSLASHLWELVQ